MRGVISYVLAGVVVMLAIDMIAPPVGLGVAVFAWPGANENALVQNVNRTHKGDRLQVPAATSRRIAPPDAPAMPIGCEAVFSSLSADARMNFPGRCVA